MNPLANIDFTQTNLDQIARALNDRPRDEVCRLLNEKAQHTVTFLDGSSLNYQATQLVSGIFAGAFTILSITLLVIAATVGTRVSGPGDALTMMVVGGVPGVIGVGALSVFIITSVLYRKHQKQHIDTEEIRRFIANVMRNIYSERESRAPRYCITQQMENILNRYFGNHPAIPAREDSMN